MMATIESPLDLRDQNSTTFPSWKLYENPFYYSDQQHQYQHHHHLQHQHQQHHHPHHRRLLLPLSARKIAASLWDLRFFRPVMDTELDIVRAQIAELRAELQLERKIRKKVESDNKKLAKELSEERKGREAMERVCQELVEQIASHKEEIRRLKREMEEERKMLRMAEVLREERVQMKLTEAKILFEEKLLELEFSKGSQIGTPTTNVEPKNREKKKALAITSTVTAATATTTTSAKESTTMVMGIPGNSNSIEYNDLVRSTANQQRKASSEAENPHIKRGIKGFVEFPKVIRAIGSRGRHLGSKLECQKAQLRLLLKQKSPIGTNNLIVG
uniref:Protein BRANCHLESS TRICHOME n=1 Tax=Nelumbo nucifera TaxID=4432 RepID=A0A822XKF0_NELNU|nr:TPA_asm: hypothetical protein HUJ06_019501 [Nelumbo nucifera]